MFNLCMNKDIIYIYTCWKVCDQKDIVCTGDIIQTCAVLKLGLCDGVNNCEDGRDENEATCRSEDARFATNFYMSKHPLTQLCMYSLICWLDLNFSNDL